MKYLILMLAFIKINAQQKSYQVVGNPLAHAAPCKGNSEVLASFESGLPPGEENQYVLNIKEDILPNFQIDLIFDSDASLTLSNPGVARITANPEKGYFNVRFFKSSPNLGVTVKGPQSGTIPYVKSILINSQEICKKPNSCPPPPFGMVYTAIIGASEEEDRSNFLLTFQPQRGSLCHSFVCKTDLQGYFDGNIQGSKATAEITHTAPDDSCGRRKVVHTELIVHGEKTNPGDWPWHVALFRVEGPVVKYICGGSLLSKTLILTAAHCATIRGVPATPQSLNVVLGKHNLIGGDIAPQEREVFEVIVHPSFDGKTLNNDIALLRLKSEAVFDDYVQPVCLWSTNAYKKLPAGTIFGTVVGWGFDQNDVLSPTLQQISIPKLSEATCLRSNPVFFAKTLNSNKFCAGYTNGTSACNGDSGGGFQVFVPDTAGDKTFKAGTWYIRGIVSMTMRRFDAPVCDPKHYVLFTDVAKYKGWINGYL